MQIYLSFEISSFKTELPSKLTNVDKILKSNFFSTLFYAKVIYVSQKSLHNPDTVWTLEAAKIKKKTEILAEIDSIDQETRTFWENQVVMKRNYENFTEFGTSLCTELSRVLRHGFVFLFDGNQ